MKLLFDQNLSPRVVERLWDLCPDSTHVYRIGLDQASDLEVWNAARTQGHVIVSQDADFSDLSAMFGAPPKVIWIRRGNRSTAEVESLLRLYFDAVSNLENDPESRILALF